MTKNVIINFGGCRQFVYEKGTFRPPPRAMLLLGTPLKTHPKYAMRTMALLKD